MADRYPVQKGSLADNLTTGVFEKVAIPFSAFMPAFLKG